MDPKPKLVPLSACSSVAMGMDGAFLQRRKCSRSSMMIRESPGEERRRDEVRRKEVKEK
jgi:hypothetical protein